MAETVKVRTLPDRIAYTDESMKRRIPNDQFIEVPRTPYIDRLLSLHGDIELESSAPAKTSTK